MRQKIHFHFLSLVKVERPCPVPKGLRLFEFRPVFTHITVERPRPVLKGLKQWAVNGLYSFGASKDPPCSKGIETFFSLDYFCMVNVERPRPVPKGLKPSNTSFKISKYVERPSPAPKGFPINHQSAVCFLNKLHLLNFYELIDKTKFFIFSLEIPQNDLI